MVVVEEGGVVEADGGGGGGEVDCLNRPTFTIRSTLDFLPHLPPPPPLYQGNDLAGLRSMKLEEVELLCGDLEELLEQAEETYEGYLGNASATVSEGGRGGGW